MAAGSETATATAHHTCRWRLCSVRRLNVCVLPTVSPSTIHYPPPPTPMKQPLEKRPLFWHPCAYAFAIALRSNRFTQNALLWFLAAVSTGGKSKQVEKRPVSDKGSWFYACKKRGSSSSPNGYWIRFDCFKCVRVAIDIPTLFGASVAWLKILSHKCLKPN